MLLYHPCKITSEVTLSRSQRYEVFGQGQTLIRGYICCCTPVIQTDFATFTVRAVTVNNDIFIGNKLLPYLVDSEGDNFYDADFSNFKIVGNVKL